MLHVERQWTNYFIWRELYLQPIFSTYTTYAEVHEFLHLERAHFQHRKTVGPKTIYEFLHYLLLEPMYNIYRPNVERQIMNSFNWGE